MFIICTLSQLWKQHFDHLSTPRILSERCSHKHSWPWATNSSQISFSFPPLWDFCVFFSCPLSVFPRLDIFVGGTFYVGWLIVMAAGSLMHGRCRGVVIPSYVSSPDVLLTAIDFYSPPLFLLFPSGLPPPLPLLQKKASLQQKEMFKSWISNENLILSTFLQYIYLLSFLFLMHAFSVHARHLDACARAHTPNVASYFKCQGSKFHFSNFILINPFKSHWGWWGHLFYLFILGWFYLGRLRGFCWTCSTVPVNISISL